MFEATEWSRARGYAVATELVERRLPADGMFCFNDSLALGALKAFHDRGVRVLDDIAVVGWDDIEEASYAIPTLTSIAPDKVAIAARAVDGLLAARAGGTVDGEEVTAPYRLAVRASSAASTVKGTSAE